MALFEISKKKSVDKEQQTETLKTIQDRYKDKPLKVLELFAGIGACSKALERLGINYVHSDVVEIDEYAVKSFNAVHNTNFEPQDITKWDKDLEVDLLMHGSPCQSFSIAGKQEGGDEGSGTRSSLMYETVRIIKKLRPKFVIWENVKNVLSNKHNHNFYKYLNYLNDLGYNSFYNVLNAKDYGIPQNRERIFIVSINRDYLKDKKYKFPEKQDLLIRLKDLLEKDVEESYYLNEQQVLRIKNSTFVSKAKSIQTGDVSDTLCVRDYKDPKCVQVAMLVGQGFDNTYDQQRRVYSENGISPTITTGGSGDKGTKVEVTVDKNVKEVGYVPRSETGTQHQSNTVYDSEGVARTLTASDYKSPMMIVADEVNKNAKHQQDLVNTEDGIARTLVAGTHGNASSYTKTIVYNNKEVELPCIGASRGRNVENPSNRDVGQELEQTLEINTDGVSNTLTTFQKDNYVIEEEKGFVEKHYENFVDKNGYFPEMFNPYNETEIKDVAPTMTQNCGTTGSSASVLISEDKKIDGVSVIGNYSPSGYEASRIVDKNGLAPTVKENHGTVTAIVEGEIDIDNPLKGKTDLSWQFEQNVYSENTKCVRAVKAGGGSGNIPKVILNNETETLENKKEQLCDYLIEHKMVKENDVISHNYTESRMKDIEHNKDIVLSNNMSPTLSTRGDTLGVVVNENKEVSSSTNTQDIVPNLRVRKLTAKECWRLMGFDDEDYDKASQVNSRSQLYKQAGNSIVVNVLEKILQNLL